MYRIDILTLFDETVGDVLSESILGRAQERDLIRIETHQIRDYTRSKQKQVDDYPYGGGHGAVLQADPLFRALEHVKEVSRDDRPHVIFLSPCGVTFTQKEAIRLKENYDHLVLVCGHYEGVDQRFIDKYVDEEISLGDFVLTGGEIAAMAVADAVCRMIPGVLSDPECYEEESHYSGLLEYPQYSRPEVWQDLAVPQALLTGDHASVERWRRKEQLLRTRARRPDLYAAFTPQSDLDRDVLAEIDRDDRRNALGALGCRPATEEDLPAILAATNYAKATLKARGADQWQDPAYPAEADFRADMAKGSCYVLTCGGQVAAFFVLSGEPEAGYAAITDGKWRSDEPYGVIHRCAVAQPYRGLGLSDELIARASDLTRAMGRRWLRVDTHKKNKPMRDLLARTGFDFRGNVLVAVKGDHDPHRMAFDRLLD